MMRVVPTITDHVKRRGELLLSASDGERTLADLQKELERADAMNRQADFWRAHHMIENFTPTHIPYNEVKRYLGYVSRLLCRLDQERQPFWRRWSCRRTRCRTLDLEELRNRILDRDYQAIHELWRIRREGSFVDWDRVKDDI